MAFTYVTVICDYDLADGTDPAGTVTFTLTEAATNGGVVNYPAPVVRQIDIDGVLSVDLAANTDPDTSPTGTAYKVVEHLNSVTRTYYVEIPHDAGSSVTLSSLTPLVAAPGLVGYLTQTVADDRYLSIAAADTLTASAQYAGLGILRGAFATRDAAARPIVYLGDSITAGSNASDAAHRWVNVLTARLQGEYPLTGGGGSPSMWASVAAAVAAAPLSAGVQGVNAGIASRTSANYVDSSDIVNGIGTIKACVVFHTIGTNDLAAQTALATYKTNIQTQIAAIKAVSTVPCLHVLVHLMDRSDLSTQPITWAQYGTAMAEIAAADSSGDVVYFDLNGPFTRNGWLGSDPLNLVDTDGVHPTNSGHVLIADLLFGGLLAPLNLGGVVAPALTNISLPTITGTATEGQTLTAGHGSWTPTPGSYTYQWRRDGVSISGATATTYVLVTADVGSVITVAVTAAKTGYSSTTAVSAGTGTVGSSGGGGGATVTDSFTRANTSGTPGTTETGSLAWTVLQGGTWGISSNQLACQASVDSSCVVNTGVADGTVQITLPGSTLNRGLGVRMSADGSQGYVIWRDSSGTYQATKKNSGYTTLATSTGVTPGSGDVVQVVLAGNNFTVKVGGTTAMSFTDSTYATNTRHGLWSFNTGDLFDTFSFTP